MTNERDRVRQYILIVAGIFFSFPAASTEDGLPDLKPNPTLAATEVVRIQLEALASNDSPHPDAGIEITFRFASPTNKRVTGPLERFKTMVKNPVYRPMINHTRVEYGEGTERRGFFQLPVILTAADGYEAGYVFILRKIDQDSCAGCWMTESVIRIGSEEPPPVKDKGTGV